MEKECSIHFFVPSVIKRNNVVQLDVDTEGGYTVGPPLSSYTNTSGPLFVGGLPGTVFHKFCLQSALRQIVKYIREAATFKR